MKRENIDIHNLEDMCATAVEEHLGDISDLSGALANRVREVYGDFVQGYLNLLRQKENRHRDWFPATWSLDPELADAMRHFFSDYQHIANAFLSINHRIEQLRKIDPERQPELYREAAEDILKDRDQ
jgi:AcrR family transcriptional regulator